jgi:hypothetical protein
LTLKHWSLLLVALIFIKTASSQESHEEAYRRQLKILEADQARYKQQDAAWDALVAKVKVSNALDWRTMKWTADSTPLRSIRQGIDQAIAKGRKPADLAVAYRVPKKDLYDTKAQFRWAYASYRASKAVFPSDSHFLTGVVDTLDKTIKVPAYEWTRLRFLVGAADSYSENLVPAGERLLKSNPKDTEIKYRLVELLGFSSKIKHHNRAVVLAQQMVQSNPKESRFHSMLGGAYLNLWRWTKDPVAGQRAVASYRTYLKIEPKHPFRSYAQFWINRVERESKRPVQRRGTKQ